MKLGLPEHVCKYWKENLKWHYRRCGYCNKIQYNYGKLWKDALTFEKFVDLWISGMGNGDVDFVVELSHPFEARSYESWDRLYTIKFITGRYAGRSFGKYDNWNEADYKMQKEGLEHYYEYQRKPIDKEE